MFFSARLLPSLLSLILTLCVLPTLSQNCTPVFNKTYYGIGNDEALDIAKTADSGMIISGRTTSNSTSYDGFLLKLSANGSIQWAKTYGGSQFDELSKVTPTTDGGYLAIGTTNSYGSTTGETFLIKTDFNGNFIWSKTFNKGGLKTQPRRILQLSNGNYASLLNVADSTNQGDGILLVTNSVGNVLWVKTFDAGNEDGLNTLIEDGNTLVVGGYATQNTKKAVLMRLNKANGDVIWAKRIQRISYHSEEIVNVSKTQNGLSFSLSSTFWNPGNTVFILSQFKTWGDDSVIYRRRVMGATTYPIERTELRNTTDGGYIYLTNDTTPNGNVNYRKFSSTGELEWTRGQNVFGTSRRLKGLDLIGNGYLIAGYFKNFSTNSRNRIQILKTDYLGMTGSCSWSQGGATDDTVAYTIIPFNWSNISNNPLNESSIILTANNLNLNLVTTCEDTYCAQPDVSSDTSCYATFLALLKQHFYSFTPIDILKLDDGYLISGINKIGHDPLLIRLRLDGTVLWTKTKSFLFHTGSFDKLLKADDGNVWVIGSDAYSAAHQVTSGSSILKINPNTGTILWSKYIRGELYDIKPGDNGGIIALNVRGYGMGSAYVSIIKVDPLGNLTMQRQLHGDYENHPVLRKIIYDGQYIYAAGEFYLQDYIHVEKMDLAGNRIWGQTLRVNNARTEVQHLELIGDSLHLFASTVEPINTFNYKVRLSALKLHKDGQGLTGFTFAEPDFVYDQTVQFNEQHRFRKVTKTNDGNFAIAGMVKDGVDSFFIITKYSPLGQILWTKKYDNMKKHLNSVIKEDGNSLLLLNREFKGQNQVDFMNKFQIQVMKTDHNGQIVNNATGLCHNIPDTINLIPAIINTAFVFPVTPKNLALPYDADTMYTNEFVVNGEKSCSLPANCNSLNLTGPEIICNFTDTITYSVIRNPGCNLPVQWIYNSSGITVIGQTDTTLKVKFNAYGIKQIKAVLQSACGTIADSISVRILNNILSLGPDTTLCTGNSLILNARKGFHTYLWNNGTTDSTITVTQTGIYWVIVEDSCGQVSIDSVLVSPQTPAPLNAGADRIKCNSDTLHLTATAGFQNYLWSPAYQIGSSTQQVAVVSPLVDTFYIVRGESTPNCFSFDTVKVSVFQSPPINLGNDTSFCSGNSISLNAGPGFSNYLWSTGSTSSFISVSAQGLYHVKATTVEGCTSKDSLQILSVWSLPQPSLDKRVDLCEGTTRTLNPGSFNTYTWQDGTTNNQYTVSDTGIYHVEVMDLNGCRNADTVYISSISPSPSGFLPPDTAICSYGSLVLQPNSIFNSYLWSTNATSSSISITKPGTYFLQVKDSRGCTGNDSVVVAPKECMRGVFIPNAFTPNRDGKNDLFKAMVFGPTKNFQLTVYNRWGQVVFITTDPSRGWDGKIGSDSQTTAVFVWICQYQMEGEGAQMQKGTVTLIR